MSLIKAWEFGFYRPRAGGLRRKRRFKERAPKEMELRVRMRFNLTAFQPSGKENKEICGTKSREQKMGDWRK